MLTLEKTHHDKCIYYDVPAIKEWAQSCFEPTHIAFEALAMNWRGLLATRSLECATWIVNHFRRSTYTIRSR